MSPLEPADITQIQALIDARLKDSRHEAADHLDRGMLPRKVKPSATADQVLVTDSSAANSVWGLVQTAGIAADAIDGSLIADDAVDSEHYVDGSIDTVHLAVGSVSERFTWNTGTDVTANSPSELERTSGSDAWDAGAYSSEGFYRTATLSWSAGQTNDYAMMGFNVDASATEGYTDIDYCIYMKNNGDADVLESGSNKGTMGSYTTSTEFSITYDGQFVRYYMDGVLKRKIARAIGSKMYVDAALYSVGAVLTDIQYTDRDKAFGADGLPGRYSCYAYNPRWYDGATNQTYIPTTASSGLDFQTEWYDPENMMTTVSNVTRITFPVPGLYRVTACIAFGTYGTLHSYFPSIAYYNSAGAYVDGWHDTRTQEKSTALALKGHVSALVHVPDATGYNDGAYVIMQAWQNTGGNRTMTLGVGDTHFSAECVHLI